MNPILSEAIGSVLRWALALAAGFLVQRGIWSEADAGIYVAAGAIGLISIGWSMWQKWAMRLKLLTALGFSDVTELQIENLVASPWPNPSVTTTKDTIPA